MGRHLGKTPLISVHQIVNHHEGWHRYFVGQGLLGSENPQIALLPYNLLGDAQEVRGDSALPGHRQPAQPHQFAGGAVKKSRGYVKGGYFKVIQVGKKVSVLIGNNGLIGFPVQSRNCLQHRQVMLKSAAMMWLRSQKKADFPLTVAQITPWLGVHVRINHLEISL
jgi:hypothetical protein